MSQAQHEIPVVFLVGAGQTGVRTGNNAAWLCRCDRTLPLVGYSDGRDSKSEASRVRCPRCDRVYRVVAPSLKKVPTRVEEINPNGRVDEATAG